MSVFTLGPMRAALPQVAARPQPRLSATLPAFTGLRLAKGMPCMHPAGQWLQCAVCRTALANMAAWQQASPFTNPSSLLPMCSRHQQQQQP